MDNQLTHREVSEKARSITPADSRPIIQATLTAAIVLFKDKNLDWNTDHYALDNNGHFAEEPLDLPYDSVLLNDICSVCLTGAIQFAARKNNEDDTDAQDACELTYSHIFDILQEEPEAKNFTSANDRQLNPIHWNDGLPIDKGKNRVVALLQRGLDQLQ